MELTQVEEFAERLISSLSGGERQRVFLAIALAQEPKILLLDEPTAHLDINYQIELMEIVRGRAREGLAVVMALHDLNLAAYYADRVALLHRGRIVALGRPEEVLTAQNIKRTFGAEVAIGRNPLTGGLYIELAPPVRQAKEKRGRLHVVCGGGSGVEVMHALAAEYELSAGVLSPLDTDYEVARHLGAELALEAPFAPISDEAYRKNLELMEAADEVIVCAVPFGPGNLKNLKALLELPARKIYLLEPEKIAERDYTDGRATRLVRELLERGAVSVESMEELKVKLKGRKDAKVEG
jgi:iron complex transport system ATP-binding protein